MMANYDAGADASLAQAKKSAALFKKMLKANQGGHHGHGASDVRVAMHKGHKIELKTTYQVKVDGKKVAMKFAPDQDGSVAYHAIPNLAFSSAMYLVRCVIDAFPADFPAKAEEKTPETPSGHAHDHHAPPKKKAATKAHKAGH
jgi:hypothetical protein